MPKINILVIMEQTPTIIKNSQETQPALEILLASLNENTGDPRISFEQYIASAGNNPYAFFVNKASNVQIDAVTLEKEDWEKFSKEIFTTGYAWTPSAISDSAKYLRHAPNQEAAQIILRGLQSYGNQFLVRGQNADALMELITMAYDNTTDRFKYIAQTFEIDDRGDVAKK